MVVDSKTDAVNTAELIIFMRGDESGNVTEQVVSLVPLEDPKSKHLCEAQKVMSKYLSDI